jgi:hypothetical protein
MTRARKLKVKETMPTKLIIVRKSSHEETGLTLDVSMRLKLAVDRDRLDKAIEHALQARIRREESLRAIDAAIRLKGWICEAVYFKDPKLVSREMVTRAAIDFNWMAAQLERLVDPTLLQPRVLPT